MAVHGTKVYFWHKAEVELTPRTIFLGTKHTNPLHSATLNRPDDHTHLHHHDVHHSGPPAWRRMGVSQ